LAALAGYEAESEESGLGFWVFAEELAVGFCCWEKLAVVVMMTGRFKRSGSGDESCCGHAG
jgi:hypothetical protein